MERLPGIRPRLSLKHLLDVASRYACPGAQTAIVLLLLSAPLGIPGQPQLQPAWAAASVFFWSLFRPASMPAILVFALGLLLDLLTQEPVGIQVLLLLLIHGIALKFRRDLVRCGFTFVWLVFVAVAGGAALLEWLLVSGLTWHVLPPWPGLFEFGLAAGFYPFLALYLTFLHRGLAAPEKAS
jgi:rod shape-determining protein MreD